MGRMTKKEEELYELVSRTLSRALTQINDGELPVIFPDFVSDSGYSYARIIVGSENERVQYSLGKDYDSRKWEYNIRVISKVENKDEFIRKEINSENNIPQFPQLVVEILSEIQYFIENLKSHQITRAIRDYLMRRSVDFVPNNSILASGLYADWQDIVNSWGWEISLAPTGDVSELTIILKWENGTTYFFWKDSEFYSPSRFFHLLFQIDQGYFILKRLAYFLESGSDRREFRIFNTVNATLRLPSVCFRLEFSDGLANEYSLREAILRYWELDTGHWHSEFELAYNIKRFVRLMHLFGLTVYLESDGTTIRIPEIRLNIHPSVFTIEAIRSLFRDELRRSRPDPINLTVLLDIAQQPVIGRCIVCGAKTSQTYAYRGTIFYLCEKHRDILIHPYSYSRTNEQFKYSSSETVPKISLELETDNLNPRQAKLLEHGFIPTRDGSINGLEWKSPIVPANRLHYLLEAIQRVESQMVANEDEYLVNSGTHIHIDFPSNLLALLRTEGVWNNVFRPLTNYLYRHYKFTVDIFGRYFDEHYAIPWTGDRYVWVSPYSSTGRTLEWRLPMWNGKKQFNSLIKVLAYLTNFIRLTVESWESDGYGETVLNEFKRAVKAFWYEEIEIPD